MVGNPYKSRKKNTMENQESRTHSRGFNMPDNDAESNATEAAVATSAAVKEWLTSIQELVFLELALSLHRFHATANTIASFAQKVVEYWNHEHFSRMMRGQPGLGGVLPDEIARSQIAAMSDIAVTAKAQEQHPPSAAAGVRTKIGRPKKEQLEMIPLEQLTADHAILLTTRDLRDYTRQIIGTTPSEKGAALQIVMEYIRSKEEPSNKRQCM
jgi:hypothetical protein